MIRVAVIGLGRAGSRYDAKDELPRRSHVGAVLATDGMDLVAVADPDAAAREAFRDRWTQGDLVRVLSSLDELEPGTADVIALCTPVSASRLDLVRRALNKAPKLLVVEKPLANDSAEACEIVALARAQGVPLRVNFHRRFDRAHRELKESLPGTPRCAILRYGKGLFNYGSHMVDLMSDWFGGIESVQAIGSGAGEDPVVTFRARMDAGFNAIFVGVEGLDYDQFEIDLFFPDRRIEIANGGSEMRSYAPVADLFYPGYVQLGPASQIIVPSAVGGMVELYAAIRDHLAEGKPLAGCDGEQAAAGVAVLESALESVRRGGVEIGLAGAKVNTEGQY